MTTPVGWTAPGSFGENRLSFSDYPAEKQGGGDTGQGRDERHWICQRSEIGDAGRDENRINESNGGFDAFLPSTHNEHDTHHCPEKPGEADHDRQGSVEKICRGRCTRCKAEKGGGTRAEEQARKDGQCKGPKPAWFSLAHADGYRVAGLQSHETSAPGAARLRTPAVLAFEISFTRPASIKDFGFDGM